MLSWFLGGSSDDKPPDEQKRQQEEGRKQTPPRTSRSRMSRQRAGSSGDSRSRNQDIIRIVIQDTYNATISLPLRDADTAEKVFSFFLLLISLFF